MKPGNRQSVYFEKVPIHTKYNTLRDERKDLFFLPFCLCRKAFLGLINGMRESGLRFSNRKNKINHIGKFTILIGFVDFNETWVCVEMIESRYFNDFKNFMD